jgi:hypothetical protein
MRTYTASNKTLWGAGGGFLNLGVKPSPRHFSNYRGVIRIMETISSKYQCLSYMGARAAMGYMSSYTHPGINQKKTKKSLIQRAILCTLGSIATIFIVGGFYS